MREPAPGCVVPAVPALITGAVFVHAQRCGACDTAEAYQQGNAALRDTVERAWRHMQAQGRRAAELTDGSGSVDQRARVAAGRTTAPSGCLLHRVAYSPAARASHERTRARSWATANGFVM
jgi:hypothetical protein